jgi:hypothetical protein
MAGGSLKMGYLHGSTLFLSSNQFDVLNGHQSMDIIGHSFRRAPVSATRCISGIPLLCPPFKHLRKIFVGCCAW